MTPTTFMTYSMVIDLRKSVVVTWTPIRMYSTLQQGSQPLISTGITLIYFFLKACRYVFHALTKPKGGWQWPRQVVVNKSTVQIREKKATRKFANKYRDIFQNNMAEGPKDPQGPFFYQKGGKTYASLPMEMLQNIQKSPLFEKMQKDCQAEGIKIPKTLMAKDL